MNVLILGLNYVAEGLLFEGFSSDLVNKPYIVLFVHDQNGVKEGEDLKIYNHSIDGKGRYFKGSTAAIDSKHIDCPLVKARQIKCALLLDELQMLDSIVVDEFRTLLIF